MTAADSGPTPAAQPAGSALAVPDLAAIRAAAARIAPWAHRTPVLTCSTLDRLAGGRLYFKCEPFQKTGAFKFRGAANAVLALAESAARRGVVTHSSGNHGAALALAARLRGVPARVVMPDGAPEVKRAAVAGYGAEIVRCAPTLAARQETAARLVAESGATLVHPYDDPLVIAGQGTAVLELLEQAPGLELVVAPVGGGGLVSGTALAVAAVAPGVQVVAAEPAAADDAARSVAAGRRLAGEATHTVADGLRATLAERTFRVIRDRVAAVVTVEEEAILAAMRTVWERMKVVVEPSAAVAVAALLGTGLAAGRRVGVILTGGNVDLDRLPW